MSSITNKNINENTNRQNFLQFSPILQSVFGNVIVNINNDMSNSVVNLMVNESKDFPKQVKDKVNKEYSSSDNNDSLSEIFYDVEDDINKHNDKGTDNEIKFSSTKPSTFLVTERHSINTSFPKIISKNAIKFNFPIFILKCKNDFISNKVEIYNSLEKSWKPFVDIDIPSISPAFVIMKDSLCIVGGLENGINILTRVIFINIQTKETEIFHLKIARAAATAVFAKGTLYITGGLTTTGPIETAESWMFSLNSWKLISSMKEKRWYHASVEFDSKIFVSGGENESFRVLNTCEIYDPYKDSWENMKPMLNCRSKHQLLVVNNEIYALGGYYGEVLASVERYKPNEDCWVSLADLPTPMCGQKAIVYRNKIIYFCEDFAYEYNSNTNNWDHFLQLDKIDKFWDIMINPDQFY